MTPTPTRTYTSTNVPPTQVPTVDISDKQYPIWRFYYYAGSARIAMRIKNGPTDLVFFLFADHLGSTNVTSDPSGQIVGLSLYMPWGESRAGGAGTRLTDYAFDGQRNMEGSIGLQYFNARWYDSSLSRWTQPDSIVPLTSQGVQAWDRYEFVNNSPTQYNDPNGHCVDPDMCPGMPPDPQQNWSPTLPTSTPGFTELPPVIPNGPTSTPAPGIIPQPTSAYPTYTPTITSTPRPTNPPITLPTVAKFADEAKKYEDVVEPAVSQFEDASPFSVFSSAWDFTYQMAKDKMNNISSNPASVRAAVVTAENGVTGGAALAAGAAGFGAGSVVANVPGGIVGGIGAGVLAVRTIDTSWEQLNETTIFPWIEDTFGK